MPATGVDGRADRSARTHERIIESVLQLIGEGNLRPRAEEIAESAEVAVRTLFRHFDDMESLFAAVAETITGFSGTVVEPPVVTGSLEERARTYAEYRGEVYSAVRNYLLFFAARVSSEQEANQIRTVKVQDQRLRLWTALPECAAAKPVAQRAVEQLFSFPCWDEMRYEQGLSREETVESITWAVVSLLTLGQRAPADSE